MRFRCFAQSSICALECQIIIVFSCLWRVKTFFALFVRPLFSFFEGCRGRVRGRCWHVWAKICSGCCRVTTTAVQCPFFCAIAALVSGQTAVIKRAPTFPTCGTAYVWFDDPALLGRPRVALAFTLGFPYVLAALRWLCAALGERAFLCFAGRGLQDILRLYNKVGLGRAFVLPLPKITF